MRKLLYMVTLLFYCLNSSLQGLETDSFSYPLTNPLKDLPAFVFIPYYQSEAKRERDEHIMGLMLKELEKITKVVRVKMTNLLDLSFLSNPALVYEIKDVVAADGRKLPMIYGSFQVQTPVLVERSQQMSSPYVWTVHCFLKGNLKEHLEESIATSLQNLLQQFVADYTAVNAEKKLPTIYFWSPFNEERAFK